MGAAPLGPCALQSPVCTLVPLPTGIESSASKAFTVRVFIIFVQHVRE